MYLKQHVYQADVAKYFKISPALVSRLVKEAQENPKRIAELKKEREKKKQKKEAIVAMVNEKLEKEVPI